MARQVEHVTGDPRRHREVVIGQAAVVDVIRAGVPSFAELLPGPHTQTVDPAVTKVVVVLLPRDGAEGVRPRRLRTQAELSPYRRRQPERGIVQPGEALIELSAHVSGDRNDGAGVELEGRSTGGQDTDRRIALDVPLELAEADVVFVNRAGIGVQDPEGARHAGPTQKAGDHHAREHNLHSAWSSTPLP